MSEFAGEGAGLNAGAFMAQAASEGMGVVEARTAMREAGLQMSNATFSSMYGEIRAAVGERDAIQSLDYGAIPPGDAYTGITMGEGGDFATFVTSYVRVPGQDAVETRYFTYVTGEPHSPQQAIDAAADFYTADDLTADSMAGGNYVGSVVTSMTQTRGG